MNLDQLGKRIVVVLLVLALIVIGIMIYKVFTLMPVDRTPVLSDLQKVKIERYCKEKKVRPQVILIRWDGRMFYKMDGKTCEIQG